TGHGAFASVGCDAQDLARPQPDEPHVAFVVEVRTFEKLSFPAGGPEFGLAILADLVDAFAKARGPARGAECHHGGGNRAHPSQISDHDVPPPKSLRRI